MKSYGSSACPERLITFDADSHPLLNEVWSELEKVYPGLKRYEIYNKLKGKVIEKYPYTAYRRNMPRELRLPVESISEPNECSGEVGTELELFLEKICNIEGCAGDQTTAQAAIEAVKRLPEHNDGVRKLKEILFKEVSFLDKNFKGIGYFVIIPDKSAMHLRDIFTDFSSFREEFLKLTKQVLQDNKRPDFDFSLTPYAYLMTQIQHVASSIYRDFDAYDCLRSQIQKLEDDISRFCGAEDYPIAYVKQVVNGIIRDFDDKVFLKENLGSLLYDAYDLASLFERNHHELFYSDIIFYENLTLKQKTGKIMQALSNLRNCEVWQQYNAIKALNPSFTDSKIAIKIFSSKKIFKTVETIKVCIKDGKRISREIENEPALKTELLRMGAHLNELPQVSIYK